MRKKLAELLHKKMSSDSSVYLLFGDLGYGILDKIRKDFPDRAINCGIAEPSMMNIAAGLAITGKTVVVYSIASFVTLKCLEQIKLYLCAQNLHVIIIGTGAGCSYGHAGVTHHCMEDLNAMMFLPNLDIYEPYSFETVNRVFETAMNRKGPSYIRLVGSSESFVDETKYDPACSADEDVYTVFDCSNILIFGNVLTNDEILKLRLETKSNVHRMWMAPHLSVVFSLSRKKIFTIEESFGGFGDLVQSRSLDKIHQIKAFPFYNSLSYDHKTLKKRYGLDYKSIKRKILKELKR